MLYRHIFTHRYLTCTYIDKIINSTSLAVIVIPLASEIVYVTIQVRTNIHATTAINIGAHTHTHTHSHTRLFYPSLVQSGGDSSSSSTNTSINQHS